MLLVDLVARAPESEATLAVLDAQELVEVVVHLPADVLAGGERHHGQLDVPAREQDPAEVLVAEGLGFDVADPGERRGIVTHWCALT